MASVEVVEVFALLELLGEEFGVVDDDAVEEPVELFAAEAVGSFDAHRPCRSAVGSWV